MGRPLGSWSPMHFHTPRALGSPWRKSPGLGRLWLAASWARAQDRWLGQTSLPSAPTRRPPGTCPSRPHQEAPCGTEGDPGARPAGWSEEKRRRTKSGTGKPRPGEVRPLAGQDPARAWARRGGPRPPVNPDAPGPALHSASTPSSPGSSVPSSFRAPSVLRLEPQKGRHLGTLN